MTLQIKPAERRQTKLRLALCGPSGSGKTYTALRFAFALAGPAGRVLVIDTEHGSASKYAGEAPDGEAWRFDVIELETFSPETYTEALRLGGEAGYDVIIIDSLSHAWEGREGALELKDRVGRKSGENSWTAWRTVTPLHNAMVDAIIRAPAHILATMRSKMDYVQETDERGRQVVRKIGMAPVQRPGMEYEFDIVIDLDWSHLATVSKSRCPAVADATASKPGPAFVRPVIDWLNSGAPYSPPAPVHWSAQPSAKFPGKTNWEAVCAAAFRRFVYHERDLLAFAGVERPDQIAESMESFWSRLEAWNPAAEGQAVGSNGRS